MADSSRENLRVVWLQKSELVELPLNVKPMDEEEKALLLKSVRDLGFVEPLQVVKYGEKYVIVNGNHRFKLLAEKLGWQEFPAVVIGENWDEAELLATSIRLNKIIGKIDPLLLRRALNKIVGKWMGQYDENEIRSRLGFKKGEKLFETSYKAVLRAREQVEKSMASLEKLKQQVREATEKSDKYGVLVCGEDFFIIRIRDEDLYKLVRDRLGGLDEAGIEKVLRRWLDVVA